MDFDNFKDFLHPSWWDRLRPWIESEDCDKLYKFLKDQSRRGKVTCPSSSNVWRAFLETPYEEVKCIIIGMSPYHTLYKGTPVSDGLLMSCSITGRIQPSLEKWYNSLFQDLGLDENTHKEPDLKFLASQGVLLLNAGLTCSMLKPGNHNSMWEPFMKYLFEECIITTGMPVIFLGKESLKIERYIAPFTWVFKLSHPAASAYTNSDWSSEGIFEKINNILQGNNNTKISWIKTE